MKKNLNKILLEAVRRGINLALDDFDDNENLIGQQTETIKDQNITTGYLDLLDMVVDLGLPSGTLWCKYNLGVNLNKLSNIEDWYGDYYAWGETNTKDNYDWKTYKFALNGHDHSLTKYVTMEQYLADTYELDNITQLQDEDDAAFKNFNLHNFKFHIPTKEQFKELLKYTTHEYVRDYKLKNLNGYILRGNNGNEIFFPACGKYEFNQVKASSVGCYWASTVNEYNVYAWCLHFDSSSIDVKFYYERFNGFNIRPVINLNE